MGRRGPPPKPTRLKKAQGTYQKCRDQKLDEVVLPPGAPPAPKGLDLAERRRWNEVVAELVPIGTLAKVDGGALEAYCRCFVQWQGLQALAKAKPVLETRYGPKINPASAEARKLHKEVIQPLELALGLHYAARARVQMPEKDPADDAQGFLFGTPSPGLRVVGGARSEAPAAPASLPLLLPE